MDEDQPGQPQPVARRTRRVFLFIVAALFLLITGGYFFLFFGLNFFGEKLLRNYLREKVIRASDSIYQVDFTSLHLNIMTGRVRIDSLQLIPDTARYRLLRLQGRTARSLYHLSLTSVAIDRVHFMQLWSGRRINFRQLVLDQPIISIVAYPDTTIQQHRRWRVIYDDIYPVVSTFFSDFHIDSVKVNRGLFLSSSIKTGRGSQGDYEFSSLLKDVAVNPFSYYNRDRVFYARSVDLVVHNFEYYLADSLYRLSAGEIGFSLTRSHIFGKDIALKPDLTSNRINDFSGGELFSFELPGFSIDGLDLYRAMTTREVHVDSVDISNLAVSVYHNSGKKRTKRTASVTEKRILSGIYSIISKEIKELSIDTVALKKASFRYFADLHHTQPEIRIGEVSLGMTGFLLDSLSGFDDQRILYAREIELLLNGFSMTLKDGVHEAEASTVKLSTRGSSIDIYDCTIVPVKGWRVVENRPPVNLFDIRVPHLGFTRIDLQKVFNHRIVEFNRLTIGEPEVKFLRVKRTKNPDPRFGKPRDFFEEENEGVVYTVLRRYLKRITGDSIAVNKGYARISAMAGEQEVPVATGSFDLTMRYFTLDSLHGMNREGFFYSRDFGLDLWSVTMRLSSGAGMVEAGKISIKSADSLIVAENLHLATNGGSSPLRLQKGTATALSMNFSLDRLELTGFDHRKLFLDKVVKAGEIRLGSPVLLIKAISRLHSTGSFQGPLPETDPEIFHTFDVGKCVITGGTLNYDGEEDRRSSHFRLNDINFNLVNARVVLPGPGQEEGMIRFDSLQLQVLPFRAILSDSTYALEAKSLDIGSYPVNIRLRDVKVIPLNPLINSQNRGKYGFSIPAIRIKGFYFDRAIFEKRWMIDSIAVDHPVANIRRPEKNQGDTVGSESENRRLFTLPLFMKELSIGRINVSHGDATLTGHPAPGGREFSLHGMNILIEDLHLDSNELAPSAASMLNACRIRFSAPGFSIPLHDSSYWLTFSRFGFDTGHEEAWLDSLKIAPSFSRSALTVSSRYGASRMEISTTRVEIKRLQFEKMLTNKSIHAGLVDLSGFSFDMFHDKRVVLNKKAVRPMPMEAIHRIRLPLRIDTVVVKNGWLSYEEQKGEKPGKIFFDKADVLLTGFSTETSEADDGRNTMELTGNARLMGEGTTRARIVFFRNHPRDSFLVQARVTSLDLKRLNEMIPFLTPVSVKSGRLDSLSVHEIHGNNTEASGRLSMRYNHLTLTLLPDEDRYASRFERLLMNEVVNFILPDNHPGSKGAERTGKILNIRDSRKGFFNFVWKSVLNGIISDLGFEKAAQRGLLSNTSNSGKK